MLRILDLFCGEGGASMGYYQAASKYLPDSQIQIIGVDNRRKVRYPFGFIEADVLTLDY
jgi:DNA (cytosine-5)-methyltransferase 1